MVDDNVIKVPNIGDHRICMSAFIFGLLAEIKYLLATLKLFIHQVRLF